MNGPLMEPTIEAPAHLDDTDPVSREDRLRVLHVMPSLFVGGMERGLVQLIRSSSDEPGLRNNDAVDHGVCILRDGDADLIARCREHAPTWVLGSDRPERRRDYGAWRRLRRVMRTFRPHVVHARSTGVWFDAALASRGYRPGRLLLAFHGRTDLEPVGQRRRVMNRWACRRADAVLSVSTEAARMMWQEWSVPADRLWTIPDGVDTQAYRPPTGDDEKQDARRRLGLADSDVGVMIVSRLVPIKALDVLLRAWRQVSLAHRAARLIVVGDGPLRGDLERQTRELRCHDVVRFLGRRDDVPGLLRGADLFVLASRYEGTNNAVQEAMATGLPIVATDVGGMRDVLTPGETGWLVPPDAPAELAQHILATLADTKARHRVGHAAREAAEREFSLEQWVGRYTGLYRALAGQPSAPAAAMEERACAG